MNLALFFDPLPETLTAAAPAPTTLAAYATRFSEAFPDWRTADLALIGLDEWRGSAAGPPSTRRHGPNEVRQRFYQLQKGSGLLRLVDLGNLRPGLTLEDTYQRLREIIGALLEENTVPILLGGSHDLDYGQFLAYEVPGPHHQRDRGGLPAPTWPSPAPTPPPKKATCAACWCTSPTSCSAWPTSATSSTSRRPR